MRKTHVILFKIVVVVTLVIQLGAILPINAYAKTENYQFPDGSYCLCDVSDEGIPNGQGNLFLVNGDNLIIDFKDGKITKINMSAKDNKKTYSVKLLNDLLLGNQVDNTSSTNKEQVNYNSVNIDHGLLINGYAYIPMREIFEELGATIGWDGETQTVAAKKDKTSISLKIGSINALINDKNVVIDVAPQLINSETFVPVRFVSESLGATVEWNDVERMAIIKMPNKEIYLGTHYYFTIDGQSFVYEGEVANGLPNGFGYSFSGNTVYSNVVFQGFWKDGHPLNVENNNQQSTTAENEPNAVSVTFNGNTISKGMTMSEVVSILGEPQVIRDPYKGMPAQLKESLPGPKVVNWTYRSINEAIGIVFWDGVVETWNKIGK